MEQTRQGGWAEGHEEFIAEKIDAARDICGMSVAELARRSMIGEARLGRLLRRERKMRAGEAMRLCYALELGFSYLVPGDLERELARVNKRKPGQEKKRR